MATRWGIPFAFVFATCLRLTLPFSQCQFSWQFLCNATARHGCITGQILCMVSVDDHTERCVAVDDHTERCVASFFITCIVPWLAFGPS